MAHLARIPPAPPPTPGQYAAALVRFEGELGGREALLEILAHAPVTKDQEYALGLLADPTFAGQSLAEICRRGNIKLSELWQLLRTAVLAKAAVQSTLIVGKRLPAVVSDVMERAAPYEETCGYCEGVGQIVDAPSVDEPNPEPYQCPECKGKGLFKRVPELERQVIALKLGGLLRDGGGFTINNLNQAIANPEQPGSYEQLLTDADTALEGEVVREAPIDPDDVEEAEA
jgi:DNA-directed RNA polymerase subunit RPC12/RpoP